MKQEKEQCHWAEDEHGNWFSGCDHAFAVDHGSPHDNAMMFCPFCGGRLIEHKYNFTASSDVAETPPVAQSPATNEPFRVLNTLGAAGGDYSDTPETDEFERATCYGNQSSLDFARKLERERNALSFLLQRTHYNLIGRHGWGDPDAVLIGEAMGWDSGNSTENANCQSTGATMYDLARLNAKTEGKP